VLRDDAPPSEASPLRRELLVKGRKFDFERVWFACPDGSQQSLEVVRHPGAVVVLPALADGRIALIRNQRPAVGRTLWELPAGTLEPGEDPIKAAARELREETGFEARRIAPLGAFYTTPGMTDELMRACVAFDLTPGEQRLERDERIEVVLVGLDEALAMLDAGELMDAKSMLTLLLALRKGLLPVASSGAGREDGAAP